MAKGKKLGKPGNSFRIIGGEWRSRRFVFPPVPGVRPTPDRVRETVFNWLQPILPGAVCLDLYAGSGALGLESLSRGARHVDFVDQDSQVCGAISQHLAKLHNTSRVHRSSAESFLKHPLGPYDIVFLDPPFKQDLLPRISALLETQDLMAESGRVYVESETGFDHDTLPQSWVLTKNKRAGQVEFSLFQRVAPNS